MASPSLHRNTISPPPVQGIRTGTALSSIAGDRTTSPATSRTSAPSTQLAAVGVDVDLPKEQTNTMSQSQLPVIVSLTDKGDIFISYESNVDVPVSEPELINTLSNLQSQSDNSNAEPVQVMINADQNNQYGAIMTLMATLQQAGIEKVGLLTGAPLPTPSL